MGCMVSVKIFWVWVPTEVQLGLSPILSQRPWVQVLSEAWLHLSTTWGSVGNHCQQQCQHASNSMPAGTWCTHLGGNEGGSREKNATAREYIPAHTEGSETRFREEITSTLQHVPAHTGWASSVVCTNPSGLTQPLTKARTLRKSETSTEVQPQGLRSQPPGGEILEKPLSQGSCSNLLDLIPWENGDGHWAKEKSQVALGFRSSPFNSSPTFHQGGGCQHTPGKNLAPDHFRYSHPWKPLAIRRLNKDHPTHVLTIKIKIGNCLT